MSAFEGFRGLELARPIDGLQQEHVVILRFDSPDHLARWETSEIRRICLAKADRFTEQPVSIQHIGGMEGLFTLGRSNVALAPPKYKMVIAISALPTGDSGHLIRHSSHRICPCRFSPARSSRRC